MLSRLKSMVKRYPRLAGYYRALHRKLNRALLEIRDVRDTFLSRPRKAEMTPYGFKLLGSSSIHHRKMKLGIFELEETAIIRHYLDQAQVFVDVGANIGFYTCLARSTNKHVIAIEPLQQNLNHLYANLNTNHWNDVEVYPVGLSDRPGLVTLYGASMTGASLINGWAGASERFQRTIPVTTLDILLNERFEGKKLLIKIDVEGVEYLVLQGGIKALRLTPRPTWMIEICLSEYYPAGLNPNYAVTFALFWQNGYEARTANQEGRVIKPTDVERWVRGGYCDSRVINYIFVPLEHI